MARAEKQSKYPKTLWSSEPGKQTRIFIPDPDNRSHVTRTGRFREGSVDVNNEYEEQVIRNAMRGRVYDQDLESPKVDKQSGWVCYSTDAFLAYTQRKLDIASATAPR